MYPYLMLFGQKLQSYHVCAASAGAAGIILAAVYLKKKKLGAWAFFLPLITAAGALIGARLLNYITNPRAFSDDFPVWTLSYRKLSLMGGLIAGTVILIVCCLLKKADPREIADAFAVPAAAGIVILKLGCFLNGCCHGKPTEGPFGMIFPANESKYTFINSLTSVSAKSPVVHPTQLYEMAGALIAIAAAVILQKKMKLRHGSRAAIFAALFAAARWMILPLRELPYDKQIITTFYPCLYAAVICCAAVFLISKIFKKDD